MEFGSAHRWGRSVSKGGRAFGLCLADRLWGEVSATPVLAGTPSPAHRLPPCVSTGVVELSASTLLTHVGMDTRWPVAVLTDSACRLLFDTPSMSADKATTAAVDGYPGNKVPPAQTLFVVVLAVIVVWDQFSTRGSLRAEVCAPSSVRNNLHAEALPQPPDPSPCPPPPTLAVCVCWGLAVCRWVSAGGVWCILRVRVGWGRSASRRARPLWAGALGASLVSGGCDGRCCLRRALSAAWPWLLPWVARCPSDML